MSSTTPLTISAPMLRDHLAYLTVGYFDQRSVPPSSVEGYAEHVKQVRRSAERSGDLPWFILGLQYVMLTPSFDAGSLNEDGFAFSSEDMREIIAYVLKQIAPDGAPQPGGPASRVTLAEMDADEWRALRETQSL